MRLSMSAIKTKIMIITINYILNLVQFTYHTQWGRVLLAHSPSEPAQHGLSSRCNGRDVLLSHQSEPVKEIPSLSVPLSSHWTGFFQFEAWGENPGLVCVFVQTQFWRSLRGASHFCPHLQKRSQIYTSKMLEVSFHTSFMKQKYSS